MAGTHNGHDLLDSGEEISGEEISGKKHRNESEWKQNQRKRLRAEGKEYTNCKGNQVPARKTGEKCRCSRQCLQSFSDESKQQLLSNFNALGDQKAQDAYLTGGILPRPVQRRRSRTGGDAQRSCHIFYSVKVGEEKRVVCREGYASLHGVSTSRIRRIGSDVQSGSFPIDHRGKHNNRPRSLSEESSRLIDGHIRLFLYQISHYGREHTKRRYLASELSVRHMYLLFLQVNYPETYLRVKSGAGLEKVECHVRFRTYYNYFKDNFNYGFGRPKTDICGTCAELQVKISTEKNVTSRRRLQTEFNLHKRKAAAFYNKLKSDTTRASNDEKLDVLTIDYQQNIPFPHHPVGEIFYMRQLCLYNFAFSVQKLENLPCSCILK